MTPTTVNLCQMKNDRHILNYLRNYIKYVPICFVTLLLWGRVLRDAEGWLLLDMGWFVLFFRWEATKQFVSKWNYIKLISINNTSWNIFSSASNLFLIILFLSLKQNLVKRIYLRLGFDHFPSIRFPYCEKKEIFCQFTVKLLFGLYCTMELHRWTRSDLLSRSVVCCNPCCI